MNIKDAFKNISDKKIEQKYSLSTEDIDRLVIQDQQGRIVRLTRIVANKDFKIINGFKVSKGDKGGFVESEENISQEGNCWVFGNALVYGDANVKDNAIITNNTIVRDAAKVSGNGIISSSVLARTAKVHNADIENCYIEGWGSIFSKYYQPGQGASSKNMKISNSQFRAGYDVRNENETADVRIDNSNIGNASVYVPENLTNKSASVYINNSEIISGSQVTVVEDLSAKQNEDLVAIEDAQNVSIGRISLVDCKVESSNIQVSEFSLPFMQEGKYFAGVAIKPAKIGESTCDCVNIENHNTVQIPLENNAENALEQ